MDRFHALQVFVRVAERGGFAAAARDLAMSPPAVTRAVAALEVHLGTPLFRRTTRSVRPTESGERFLADGRRILAELEEAEQAAVGSHAEPQGEVRITAPSLFGRHYVAPVLGDFLDIYPRITAETLFVDRVVNLLDEGLDVAVRIGDLPDSTLVATRVGTVRRVVVASPGYLARHGLPQHPADLGRHRVVQTLPVTSALDWPFQEDGRRVTVRVAPRLRMNTNDAVIAVALRDWGIARLLSYQVAPYLADGRLKTVLGDFELPALPIHVVHQEGRRVSSRVRALVDFLVDRLRAEPGLN